MHRHREEGESTLANDKIVIKGAREHNLKNVSLTLPREKFIVMTGLSGSGKSSLAFDTIYADGQRRYVESLSSYARMFLGRMDKPDVDEITGLSPAISIDQKTTSHNPRSTVGTVTEIYDYLRLLYARVGVPHCPVCGRVISQQSVDEMVDAVLKLEEGTKFQVLAPVVRQRKGTQQKELDAAGTGTTLMPRASASRTMTSPGSETQGIPASEQRAQFSPASIRRRMPSPFCNACS